MKRVKETFSITEQADAIRQPLEAAQQGLAEVSGGIEKAKSRLP